MKITNGSKGWQRHAFTAPQIWRVMKLSAFLLTVVLLQASAHSKAQYISFSGKDVPLEKVFSEIRKQTGFLFFYRTDDLQQSKPVSISLEHVSLEAALNKIFANQPLSYSLKDKTVIVTLKTPAIIMLRTETAEDPGLVHVRGTVVNEKNEPVIVSVTVKGSNQGTSTDEKGRFELQNVNEKATLVFTGINIETKELKLAGKTELLVTVQTKIADELEVVVSTGYQNLKKGQLTGAYATVNRERYLQAVPVTGNIVDNMEGRIAGLMLNMNQSRNNWRDAGNTSPFTIRGVSTFEAIKKPLIVLNGYPTEVDIESINPFDIESITVLKDAASAAIYGVRASNGVVVINTKKGANNKPVFHFTTAQTYKPRPNYNKLGLLKGKKLIDFEVAKTFNDIEKNFSGKEYIDMNNGSYTPVYSIADDLYNGLITQEEADKLMAQYANYDNTEDYMQLFLQPQHLQTYDFNVSGGGTNSTYFLGLNRVDNGAAERYTGNNKTSINYRGAFDFSKRISLDLQTVYSQRNTRSAVLPDYFQMQGYQKFKDDNGNALPSYYSPFMETYYGFGDSYGTISKSRNDANMELGLYDEWYYPYREMYETRSKSKTDIYRLQGNLKIKLLPGLNLETGGVYEGETEEQITTATENAYETRIMLNYYAAKDPITGKPIFRMPQGGVKKTVDNRTTSYTLRAQITYNKDLSARHSISLLGGAETRKITSSSRLNTAFGYDSRLLSIKPMDLSMLGNRELWPDYFDVIIPVFGFAMDQTQFTDFYNETAGDDRFVSWYANAAYTLDQKYAFTGSLRIDQSNLFGNDPKFRYTPLWSAGASWNIHRENFMLNAAWLDELKLRVAAGYNGNIIKRAGPFNILRSFINNQAPNYPVGYAISTPRNNSLRWEKTLNFNTGVDFAFFKNKVSGSVDYYIKRGTDIFSPIEADPTKGFSNVYTNNASIENRGIDLSLVTTNVKNSRFMWQTQVTGSFNKSKVVDIKNKWNGFYNFTRAGGAENIVGLPMNTVLAFNYAGLNADGIPMVRNEKGELVIISFASQTDIAFSDLKKVGTNDPKYVIGFNNHFTFGNFSLSAMLMYYGGHVALISPPGIYSTRPLNGIENMWRQPGDEKNTDIPGFGGMYGSPGYIELRYAYMYAEKFVRKMDYITLRNVTFTYNMNNQLTRKAGLNNTKLILQVQNAFKHVFSGNDVDPETLNFVSGTRGLPVVPAFTFSLSTNF